MQIQPFTQRVNRSFSQRSWWLTAVFGISEVPGISRVTYDISSKPLPQSSGNEFFHRKSHPEMSTNLTSADDGCYNCEWVSVSRVERAGKLCSMRPVRKSLELNSYRPFEVKRRLYMAACKTSLY